MCKQNSLVDQKRLYSLCWSTREFCLHICLYMFLCKCFLFYLCAFNMICLRDACSRAPLRTEQEFDSVGQPYTLNLQPKSLANHTQYLNPKP